MQPEVRFRRKWRRPRASKSRCLGHCSAPAYSRTFSTVTTCTTPFVKGKISVIVKPKSVGATKQKLRQLNTLDRRWL